MNKILFVPVGGLGNRMKSIAAAVRLGQSCGSRVIVKWFQDWGLGCRFHDLFCDLDLPLVDVQEAAWSDKLLYDRPRRHNLWLPALYQHVRFQGRMDEIATLNGMEQGADFTHWAEHRDVWMASYVYFMSQDIPDDAFDIFHPVASLQQRIDERVASLGERSRCIGVHIRRTDNVRAIATSPTEAFVERMRRESPDTVFYLATDSEEVKRQLINTFGPERIRTSGNKAERGSLQGMQDAAVELYTLAHCPLILGSSFSTFTTTAASIGRSRLETISQK